MLNLTPEQKKVIVDGLVDLSDELRWPGQSWANVFDYRVADVTEGRKYLERIMDKAHTLGDIEWVLDFCENVVDGDPNGDWVQVKAQALWDYIVRVCLVKPILEGH